MQEAHLLQTTPPIFSQNVTSVMPRYANSSHENQTLFNPPIFIDVTPRDWGDLVLDVRVDTVMMTCLQFKEERSPKNILSQMIADKKAVNRLLAIYEEESLRTIWHSFFESQQKRLLTGTFDETRRALRKQCAVEEPAIGVGCRAKQATHHAVKSWWEAQA